MSKWITTSLGDLGIYINGRAFKPEEWSVKGLPIIRIENLNNPNAVYNYYEGVLQDQYKVDNGDILVSWSASLDSYVWNSGAAALNQHIFKAIPNEKVIDKDFFFFLLKKAIKGLSDLVHGATMKHVNRPVFENFQVRFPEQLDVQKEIASNLRSKLNEIENAHRAMGVIAKDLDRLRYLTLEAFFADMHSDAKFKIGDKAETTSGSTPSRDRKKYWEPAEIPWIKTGEIAFLPIHSSEEYVSRNALSECSIKLLPADTVLIAMYGQGKTRGQSAILKIPATINQACFAILPNDTWMPEFLQLWLMYSYLSLRAISENRGGNQANLNGSILNSFEVPAPDLTCQKEIVQKIDLALLEIEKMKENWKSTLSDIRLLPNQLLAQAFKA